MYNSNKKKILGVVTVVVLILLGSYIYYQSRDFFLGPRLSIEEPSVLSSTVTKERLMVSGIATNISALTLNGSAIPVNQHNSFHESLLLAPGFNIIEVVATDRFGHARTETRTIIYEAQIKTLPVATTTISFPDENSEQSNTSTTTL